MKHLKKKGILFLIVVFIVSIFIPVKTVEATAAAQQYDFHFTAWICNVDNDEVTTEDCKDSYYEGDVLSPLSASNPLNPGTQIMLVLEHENGFVDASGKTAAELAASNFNINVIYDSSRVEPLLDEYDDPALYDAWDQYNPIFEHSDKDKKGMPLPVKNQLYTVAVSDSQRTKLNGEDLDESEYMSEVIFDYTPKNATDTFYYDEGPIGFMFFVVKENAPAGDFSFTIDNLDGDGSIMSSSSGYAEVYGSETIPFTFTPMQFTVAGETTNDDSSLELFTAKSTIGGTEYSYKLFEENTYETEFTSGTDARDFYMIVPAAATSVTISGKTTDPLARFIVPDSTEYTNEFPLNNTTQYGNNQTFKLSFIVQSADTTKPTVTYNVYVYRLSSVSTLQSLSTSGDVVLNNFSANTTVYPINTIYNTVNTTVTAKPTHANGFVTDTSNVQWTKNASTGNYTQSFALPGYGTSDVNTKVIKVQAEDALSKYNDSTKNTYVPGNTQHTQNYTINVTRANPSTDTTLKVLKVGNTSILQPGQTLYNQGVQRYSVSTVNITAQANDSKATLVGDTGTQSLSPGSWNTFTVTVRAEDCKTITGSNPSPDCHTQDYTLKFYRNDNNNYLNTLSITGTNISMNPSLADDHSFSGPYVVRYPSGTESVDIEATTEDTEATITWADGITGNGTNEVSGTYSDFNNQLSLIVTSEDGEQKTYTIRFEKILSTESRLAGLSLSDGTNAVLLDPAFSTESETRTYQATVDGDVEEVTIDATLIDSDLQSFITETDGGVDTYYGPRTVSLNYGPNTIYVKVQGEAPSAKTTYILQVTRNRKSIKTLSDLTVDGTSVTDPFVSSVHAYTINVPYETTSVTVAATVTPNSEATYAVLNSLDGEIVGGVASLNTGDNIVKVRVFAQDGSHGDYTLTIKRAYNTDATITGVKVFNQDATCDFNTKKCTITVTNDHATVTPSDVVIQKNDPNAVVTQPDGTINLVVDKPSVPATNSYLFSVRAEDPTATPVDYELIITRQASSVNTLSEASAVTESGATYRCQEFTNYSCTITVPSTTTSYTLSAVPTANSNATVTGTGNFTMNGATDSRQERVLTVTAENETSQTYTIVIERGKSTNANLSGITIDGHAIETYDGVDAFDGVNTQVYAITVPGLTSQIELGATVDDTGKAVIEDEENTLGTKILEYGGNTYTIKVIAEAGVPNVKTYTVTITRALNIDSSLSMIQVKGENLPGFASNTLEYDYNSEYYQNLADSNPLMVPYTTTSLVVTGTVTDTQHATVAYKVDDTDTTSTVPLHTGLNTIKVIGIAHNTTIKTEYVLKVYRALNTNNSISTITVAGVQATWNAQAEKYTVTVPNNVTSVSSSNVVVTIPDTQLPTDPQATVTIPSMDLKTDDPVNDNVNNYQISVRSEAGQTKTYNVEITRTKSAVNTLQALTVSGGAFSPSFLASQNYVDGDNTNVYTVIVGAGTTSFTVSYVKDDPKSNVEVVGGANVTMDESQKTVIVNVTAENGSVNTYTLNVERTESVVMTLSSITVNSGDTPYALNEEFTPDRTNYTVTVPGTVSEVNIDASVVDNRAKIKSGTGVHSLTKDPDQDTFTIRVETENGSAFLDYTVKVYVLPKTDNTLDTLTVSIPHGSDPATPLSLSPSYDDDVLAYTISDQPYSVSKINIVATVSDSDATLKINGVATESEAISQQSLNVGTNVIPITVTAEDGKSRTYRITVKRAGNNDATLSNLNISGGSLTPTFAPGITTYTVTLSATTDTLDPNKVTATPADSNARVTMDSELTITGEAEHDVFKIYVLAEDQTTTETYTVNVVRRQSNDATLKKVTLEGATLDGSFLSSNHTYVVNVPSTSETFTITGEANSPRAQGVVGNGTYNVSETPSVTLTVTAEDGTTDSYVFTIYTASAQDATLANLEVQGYTLNPGFLTTTQTYDIGEIYLGIDTLNVIGTPTNSNAKVYYFIGTQTPSLSNLVTIPQALGNYTISVKVVPATGIDANARIYSINFKVVTSGNNYLSKLVPSTGTLNPKFNKLTTSYSMSVPFDTTSVTFDVQAEDASASVAGGDGTYSFTNIESKQVTASDLKVGANSYTIHVKAANNEIQDYTISIQRNNKVASDDVYLSGLTVDSFIYQETTYYPELSQAFNKDLENYSIGSIPFGVTELTVRPSKNLAVQTITYELNGSNDRTTVNADGSGKINVNDRVGSNIIGIVVQAENGETKTYQITYTRTPSSNVFLESMVDSLGKISSFNKLTPSYEIDVDKTVSTLRLTLTTEDKNSTITINGETRTHQWAYTTPTLAGGANTVTILVTAENNDTKTYTLVINKEGASELITSRTFGHNISDGYIKSAILGESLLDLKNELDNDNSKLQIWNAKETEEITNLSTLVATGQIVKLVNPSTGAELDRKIVVVLGDADGNGSISLFDSVKIVNHYLEKQTLTGAFALAADVDKNASITLFDSVKIVNHYLDKKYIDYTVE